MRVAQITLSFSPLTETFIYDPIAELARRGIEVPVITFERVDAARRPHEPVRVVPAPARARPDRIALRLWDGLRGNRGRSGSRAPRADWVLHRRALAPVLRDLRPDVVHAHFGTMGVLVLPLTRAEGIPLVVTFYGFDLSRLARAPGWRAAYGPLWRDAAAVVTVSDLMRRRAVELGCPAGKARVVHIGQRLGDYPFRARTGPARRLVSVGRLVEKKGHLDAVRAIARARARGVEVSLRIVGDGPLAGPVAREAAALGVADLVTLLGPRPHREVVAELEAADAFLLTSKVDADGEEEGIPTVLGEAQAVGLPCVSTRHAGIPEGIPPEGHGLLADEGDVPGIADALARLVGLSDAERLRIGEAGLRHVTTHFALDREVDQLAALYREAAASTPSKNRT